MSGIPARYPAEGGAPPALLGPADPPPFSVVNADGRGPMLLVCDHASNRIPAALGSLGLARSRLQEHIAWDIGAATVAGLLSDRFDAPLVRAGYSRLVIDCNRNPEDPTSIAAESDGIAVPGNGQLDRCAADARIAAIFEPYHAAIEARLERAPPVRAFVSLHSFTPVFAGRRRPWHVGVLWNRDGRLAVPFMAALAARGDVTVGDNQPYSARNNFGHTVHRHGEARRLPHLLVEIRQDLIADEAGAERWTGIVGDALQAALDSLCPDSTGPEGVRPGGSNGRIVSWR